MTTSQTSSLSKPSGSDRIPAGTFGYFRSRNRHRVHSLVLNEFRKSGMSQVDLARRLGKGTDVVCRWLGAPGNWTLDTVSDLLFAISGAEAAYDVAYPLDVAARNSAFPEWLVDEKTLAAMSRAATAANPEQEIPPKPALAPVSPASSVSSETDAARQMMQAVA